MNVDTLLARLDRPRRTGPHSWRAPCPAHGGKNRSALAIRELDDGRVLIHCHAHGCAPADILTKLGLDMQDLFADRLPDHRYPQERRPLNPWDLLATMAHELACAVIVICDIAKRGSATDDERAQLLNLAGLLNARVEVARGR